MVQWIQAWDSTDSPAISEMTRNLYLYFVWCTCLKRHSQYCQIYSLWFIICGTLDLSSCFKHLFTWGHSGKAPKPCFRWQLWIGRKISEDSALLSAFQSATTTGHTCSLRVCFSGFTGGVCLTAQICIPVEDRMLDCDHRKELKTSEVGIVSKKRGDHLWLQHVISLVCLMDQKLKK